MQLNLSITNCFSRLRTFLAMGLFCFSVIALTCQVSASIQHEDDDLQQRTQKLSSTDEARKLKEKLKPVDVAPNLLEVSTIDKKLLERVDPTEPQEQFKHILRSAMWGGDIKEFQTKTKTSHQEKAQKKGITEKTGEEWEAYGKDLYQKGFNGTQAMQKYLLEVDKRYTNLKDETEELLQRDQAKTQALALLNTKYTLALQYIAHLEEKSKESKKTSGHGENDERAPLLKGRKKKTQQRRRGCLIL